LRRQAQFDESRRPRRPPPQPHVRVDEHVDSLPLLCHGGRIPQAVSRG
jgi:hypothetical protein